jgi:hypothetical protein
MATTHNINPDLTTRAGRMLAAGRLTVTFTSLDTGEHITITTKSRKPDENGKWVACPLDEAKVIFFSVPNAGGGWDDKVGKFTYGKGFVEQPGADPARVYCAKQLVVFAEGRELPSGLRAQEEERCGKCGRALTDPVSIDRGIGPECYGQMTGSKHETKAQREDVIDAASQEMDTSPHYGSPEWDAEQLHYEQMEYETEMREGF